MKKFDVVKLIFKQAMPTQPKHEKGLAFAPTNIALCKYWGKRDPELNLPMTSSLSISLLDKGAMTTMVMHEAAHDLIILNGSALSPDSGFVIRTVQFFRFVQARKKMAVESRY